jgi:hypothetical protein
MKESNIPDRWRLSNHPLWRAAHEALRIDLPDGSARPPETPTAAFNESDFSNKVTKEVFAKIRYPSAANQRYAKLKQQFDIIAALCKNSEVGFKHCMGLMFQEENYARNLARGSVQDADASDPSIILPPLSVGDKKRGGITDSDVMNLAKKRGRGAHFETSKANKRR